MHLHGFYFRVQPFAARHPPSHVPFLIYLQELYLYRKPVMINVMKDVRRYLAAIGARGGRTSRRSLDAETARSMVRVREARRAFRRFRSLCFWSYRPDLVIRAGDVPWVGEQLMKSGNREAWLAGAKLCR